MAYSSLQGRARTSARSPQAKAICDRCGFVYQHVDLRFQFDWRGPTLANLRVLVCERCLDRHAEQLRTIVLPPDPVPIQNARVEQYTSDESDYMTLTPGSKDPATGIPVPNTTQMTTIAGANMTRQPLGKRRGLNQNAVMPLSNRVAYRVPIPVLSANGNGTNVITVTTSSAHGLSTGAQISVEGLTFGNGMYSIIVTTGTAFTYQVNQISIPAGSLLTNTTLMVTAIAGIPYNYSQIPLVGPTGG